MYSLGPPYWYMKQEHGVSSYETPEKAANSLIPLLDYAVEKLSCVEVCSHILSFIAFVA